MKNILCAIIIILFSCAPLVEAFQKTRLKSVCKTENGLLSYQGTLWHYRGPFLDSETMSFTGMIGFEENITKNPRRMDLEKTPEAIIKTIADSSGTIKEIKKYKKNSNEFEELNKIFKLFYEPRIIIFPEEE